MWPWVENCNDYQTLAWKKESGRTNTLIFLPSSLWSLAGVSVGQTQLEPKEQSHFGDAVHGQPLEAQSRRERKKQLCQGKESYTADT